MQLVASSRSSDILRFVARKAKSQSRTITLIGAGNLAQALGPALHSAGYRVEQVAARSNA